MSSKEENLKTIVEDIQKLDTPILGDMRKAKICDFVISTINGDTPTAHLIIGANLGDNNRGIIIYILTNLRLIKIDIDTNEVKSISFPLDTMIGIERKLIDGDLAQFSIAFQNSTFGLRYSPDDKKITDFFQKVDQARTAK